MDGSIIEAVVGLLASAFGVYVLVNRERLAKENNEVTQRWLGAKSNLRMSFRLCRCNRGYFICAGLFEAIRALLKQASSNAVSN
jgi:hypothetical protein